MIDFPLLFSGTVPGWALFAAGALTGALIGGGVAWQIGRHHPTTQALSSRLAITLEAERRDLAERLAMALDVTNAAAWDLTVLDGDVSNRHHWWSDNLSRMLGYPDGHRMPADFWESHLHPQDRKRVQSHMDAQLGGQSADYAYDYRMVKRDGGVLWVAARGRAIRGVSGEVERYCGVLTDITERRRQEERLRASESRLVTILEASPMAVNITMRDGRSVYSNAKSSEVFQIQAEELIGTDTSALYVDPRDREELLAKYDREGAFRDAEVRVRRPDDAEVWVLCSWGPIELEDGETALLSWIYDITDRKSGEAAMAAAKDKAEQALADLRAAQESLIRAETMASLGQLVAGVAHEINTPIGIGLTTATHIGEQTRNLQALYTDNALRRSDLSDYIETVTEGSRLLVSNIYRAAALVQSFKLVAVDQTSGERRKFELHTYIEEVLFSLRPRLKRTELAMDVDCPEGLVLDSYPGAISQVLTNLVMNALTHAYEPEQTGTISLAVHQDADKGVVLVFTDDGKGIAADHLPKVFEPFFTTKRGEGGSGLGLHIVFNMVNGVLGGQVSVKSERGKGTCFTLRIPFVAPGADAIDPLIKEAALLR